MEETYRTQGRCDRCDVPAGDLVNGLTLCACLTGIGAPAASCRCDWGRRERQRLARQAEAAHDAGPRSVVTRKLERNRVPRGPGHHQDRRGGR